MDRSQARPHVEILPVELVERESVGAPAAR